MVRPCLRECLALVSVLQYTERLTDRQAADAVRGRIDWKYALGLQLADPGFDFSVLSEFRDRLIAHRLEQQILDAILAQCSKQGLLRAGGRARTDSTHVIARIPDLNRLEFVTETMRCALEALAVAAPAWLAGTDAVNADWLARYRQRAEQVHADSGGIYAHPVCTPSSSVKASTSAANALNGSCAKPAWPGSVPGGARASPDVTRTRIRPLTWCNATSPRTCRTGCGSRT